MVSLPPVILLTCQYCLVCSVKEYEEKAVSLALNRTKLQDLTNRLKAARMTCPLFDTTRWVSNWGQALKFLVLEHFGSGFCMKRMLLNYWCHEKMLIVGITVWQVKNLERAYFKMWNLYCCGQHPQPFKVTENDMEFPATVSSWELIEETGSVDMPKSLTIYDTAKIGLEMLELIHILIVRSLKWSWSCSCVSVWFSNQILYVLCHSHVAFPSSVYAYAYDVLLIWWFIRV